MANEIIVGKELDFSNLVKMINIPNGTAVGDGVNFGQLSAVLGALVFIGPYDAATNTPNLTAPLAGAVNKGNMFVVNVGGTFFGETVEVGDTIIANVNDPSSLSDYTILETNNAAFLPTEDEKDAMTAANNPSTANPFATIDDLAADYALDYYVSSDIGDDTATGLNERTAFATLEKALDTGEAGGVPYAVHILDKNAYEVQAASGTRTDTTEFIIVCPVGKITGPAAGALIWKTPRHQIFAAEIDGTFLTFSPSATAVRIQHNLGRINNPNTLYQSVGAAQDAFIIQAFVNEVLTDSGTDFGNICDLTNRGKLDYTGNFITARFVSVGLSIFKVADTDTNIFVKANNVDVQGPAGRYVVDASGGAIAYITAHCSAHNTFALLDGAGTQLFAINSDDTFNEPVNVTITNGARAFRSSPIEGFNFADLDATAGLDLADIINVRDISTGEQVKATLTDLQTIFAGAFVTIATTQTVTGTKTFIAPVTVQDGTGSGLAANTIADCFVFTSSNVNAGMSLMTIAGGNSNIFFGETGNSDKAAHIQYIGSVNELRLGASNVNVQRISGTNVLFETKIQVRDGGVFRFEVETDGTLTVGDTANYETLVTDDDDIPNKKYVDDLVALNIDSLLTTNATPGEIAKVTGLINDSINFVEVRATATADDQSEYGTWYFVLTITKFGGVAVVQQSDVVSHFSSAGLNSGSIAFTPNSGDVDIDVTGIAATNIQWDLTYTNVISSI